MKRTELKRGPGPARKKRLRPISKKMRALLPLDKKVRAAAIEICSTPCVRCAEAGVLRNAMELHHVRTRGWPSLRHKRDNLAPLCKPCHDWAHDHGKEFREWWDARSQG